MKKLLAMLVALLMLTAAVASAETSFTLADPVVTLNMGEEQTIDLTGFAIEGIAGESGGVVALQINLKGDGSTLMTINANVVASKFVFAIEGVDKTFYVDIPEGTESVASLDFSGLDIDIEALMTNVLGSIEMDGNTIKIPYTAVNDILEAIAPALESVEIPGIEAGQIGDLIAQLKESDSGVSLVGSFDQSDDAMSLAATVIPVTNGQEGDAIFNLNFDMDDTGMLAQVEIPGQFKGYFGVAPVDDVQTSVSIGGEAGGMGVDLSGVVSTGEAEAELVLLDASNAVDFAALAESGDEALSGELINAAGALIQYFLGALGAAA